MSLLEKHAKCLMPYMDIALPTADFKIGWDACEAQYLPMIDKLESALRKQPRYSVNYKGEIIELHSYDIAIQALAELEEFKTKMNGEK